MNKQTNTAPMGADLATVVANAYIGQTGEHLDAAVAQEIAKAVRATIQPAGEADRSTGEKTGGLSDGRTIYQEFCASQPDIKIPAWLDLNDTARAYWNARARVARPANVETRTYTREEVQQWRDDIAHAAADMVQRASRVFGDGDWSWLVNDIRSIASRPAAHSSNAAPEGKTEASELPPLPKCHSLYGVHLDSLHTLYTADQMHQHAMDCVITRMADVQKVLREVGAPRAHPDGSRMKALDRIRALAARSPVAAPDAEAIRSAALPKSNNGEEQYAFEEWASEERYDMTTHPMHWLFLNERTYAARQGWKAALEYVSKVLSQPSPAVKSAEPTGGAA